MRTLTIAKAPPNLSGWDLTVEHRFIGWAYTPAVLEWLIKELKHAIDPSKGPTRHPWDQTDRRTLRGSHQHATVEPADADAFDNKLDPSVVRILDAPG